MQNQGDGGRIVGVRCVRTADSVELVVHSRTAEGRELVKRLLVGASAIVSVDVFALVGDGLDGVVSTTLDLAPEQSAPSRPPKIADVLSLVDRLPLPEAA